MKQESAQPQAPDKAPPFDESNIPTLQEQVSESGVDQSDDIHTLPLEEVVSESEIDPVQREQDIAKLEAIVFGSSEPEGSNAPPAPAQEVTPPVQAATKPIAPPSMTPPPPGKPLPKTSQNPFLPQHVLDKLNQGRRNIVEEIAQSGAALDASTARLRSRANHEIPRPQQSPPPAAAHYSSSPQHFRKQQIVDGLVEEYLPLIAAELRKRLSAILDEEQTQTET